MHVEAVKEEAAAAEIAKGDSDDCRQPERPE